MRLLKCLLTENRCYKTGQRIKPRGVMVHSTGANNPLIRRYVQPAKNDPNRDELLKLLGINANRNDWNRSNLDVCVHGFIGKLADGSVAAVQTLPWDYRGWHAGSGKKGSANNTHISFEMCEDCLTDPVYFDQVYRTAVDLTALLCTQFNLNPMEDGVIICHQDGYQRGIASNHGDIYNWFPKHNKTTNDFRRDVQNRMKEVDTDMTYYKTLNDVPSYYKDAVAKAVAANALQGDGNGTINVSEDLCRTLTILDRMGKL